MGERVFVKVNECPPIGYTIGIAASIWMRVLGHYRYLEAMINVINKAGTYVSLLAYTESRRQNDPGWLNLALIADDLVTYAQNKQCSYRYKDIVPEGRAFQLAQQGELCLNHPSPEQFTDEYKDRIFFMPDGSVIKGLYSKGEHRKLFDRVGGLKTDASPLCYDCQLDCPGGKTHGCPGRAAYCCSLGLNDTGGFRTQEEQEQEYSSAT
ncbi:MAG: hypothetical protein NTY47_08475, partial [Candidatus Omnitrophica bacterium]|nr:hypothetical protein [Candidatus Omnitrophota bacterium]